MRFSGYSNSFASGEIAPDAWERGDLQQHQTGCEEALNMLGLTTGPNASRGGMELRGPAKYQDRVRREFAWQRRDGEGLVLEFGHLYARVWTARGAAIESSPGVPYEFAHPYSEPDLQGLRLAQVGDIGYLTSRTGLLNLVLKHFADDNWTVSAYELRDGPFLPENSDKTWTLTFNADTPPHYQVEASQDTFLPGHAAAIFRIRPPGGGPGVKTWAPNTAYTSGELVISDGRIYEQAGGTTSGNTPPTHDRDTVSDGAIDWTFLHDGACTVQVETVADATHALVLPQSALPLADGVATSNWSEGAFSAVRGFPSALAAIREERLCFAASTYRPDVIELSRTAGFTPSFADFKPGLGTGLVVDDDAARVRLGAKGARVVWMVDALNLLVGTTDAEYVVSGGSVEDPISPASVSARPLSSYGSADVMPAVVQGPPTILMHIAKGGRTLRELKMGGAFVEPEGRDLSLLAQHVFGLGVVEMAWSRPDDNLWLRLSDGTIACFTYHHEHQVMGVRRQPIAGGWLAEGISTSPDPDGRDRLHVAGVRVKDGVTQRAGLVLRPRPQPGETGVFLDAFEQYDGAPITVITNVPHLEGETVSVIADGVYVGDVVVTAGDVQLPAEASQVTIGLPMLRRFKSLPLDLDHTGAMVAAKARPVACWVVVGCVQADVRMEPQNAPNDLPSFERIDSRRPGDTLPVLRRVRQRLNLSGGADRDPRLVVQTQTPFDMVVYALRPAVDAQ